jgi:tetrahydromethanopterin S-methyltransferase subunit G
MNAIDNETLAMQISEQNKVIQDLQEKLKKMEDKWERTTSVLNQLLGGLFNRNTQRGTMLNHLDILFKCEDHPEKGIDSLGGWGNLPTTRQGDVLESKMQDVVSSISDLFSNQDKLQRKFDMLTDQPVMGDTKIDDRLAKLEERLSFVTDEFNETKCVVKEIAGGLFNMETQRGAWKDLRESFWHDDTFETMSEKDLHKWSQTTSRWKTLPTTRQGDECEARLDRIETKMRMIAKTLGYQEDGFTQ